MKYIKLPKTAKLIEGSKDYIDIDGKVYGTKKTKGHFLKAQTTCCGYKYCGINFPKYVQNVSKRVHRLVAEAFIDNPNNLKIVGHRNNIKSDNRVENLYWTTTSENTTKAFNDGLAKNDKGFDDSQSKPVNMYETTTNKLLGTYGSIRIASNQTSISETTISRQAKYKRPVRKDVYFRYIDDVDCSVSNTIISAHDYDTNKIIELYANIAKASRAFKIDPKIISQQIKSNQKPKRKYKDVYFLKYESK